MHVALRSADCCSLLSIVVHCCPLLSIVVRCCPLSCIVVHCYQYPLLPIVVHICPSFSIVVHCCPLLSIVVHCCSTSQRNWLSAFVWTSPQTLCPFSFHLSSRTSEKKSCLQISLFAGNASEKEATLQIIFPIMPTVFLLRSFTI